MDGDHNHLMPRKPPRQFEPQRKRTFIQAWRKYRGLSLEKVVERLHTMELYEVSLSQLSRIEAGKQPYNQDLMEALAVVLQCDVSDLTRRGPSDPESLLDVAERLSPQQQVQLAEIAKVMIRTGTGG